MKLSDITPYEKNAKMHPKKQIQQIANSIKEFGFNQPLVLDKNGVIIVGHGRYEAAKLLGLVEVPAIKLKLTEEQARAYRLADNKLNESEWDMLRVIEELKELSIEMVDLTGFERDLLIETDDRDDVVPINPPAIAKKGEIYVLGNHRVICGDATTETTYKKVMGDERADLVFTDPPYNVDYHGSGAKTSTKIMNDHMSEEKFLQFLVESFREMTYNAVKKGAAWYVFHSNRTQSIFEQALIMTGYEIRSQLIWNKPSLGLGGATTDQSMSHSSTLLLRAQSPSSTATGRIQQS